MFSVNSFFPVSVRSQSSGSKLLGGQIILQSIEFFNKVYPDLIAAFLPAESPSSKTKILLVYCLMIVACKSVKDVPPIPTTFLKPL